MVDESVEGGDETEYDDFENHQLPTIEEQLADTPLTSVDYSLTDYDDFDYTLVYIEDPPKSKVSRGHIIKSINSTDYPSVLASFDEEADTAVVFYITDGGVDAYEGTYGDGFYALMNILLCESWFVVLRNDELNVPEPLHGFFTEMTVLEDGVAAEGELWSETFARNRLKHQMYKLKNADTDIFSSVE